jgi:hypothetical protein
MRQSLYDDGVFQSGCTVDGVDASGATKKFQADEVLEFIEENGTFFASQNLLGEAYEDFSLTADSTQEDFNAEVYGKLNETSSAVDILIGKDYDDFSLDSEDTQEDFNDIVYSTLQAAPSYSYGTIDLWADGDVDPLVVYAAKIGRVVTLTFSQGRIPGAYVMQGDDQRYIPATGSLQMSMFSEDEDVFLVHITPSGKIQISNVGQTAFSITYVSANDIKIPEN